MLLFDTGELWVLYRQRYPNMHGQLSHEKPVECDYDLFEIFPDHSIQWRGCVHGSRSALEQLDMLGNQTPNECFATAILDHEVLARVNRKAGARIPYTDA